MDLLRSADIEADAGLEDNDGEVCRAPDVVLALDVVVGVALPELHLGADTQAVVEDGAACTELTLPQ